MIQVKKSFYSSLDRGIHPSGDLSVKPQQAQGYCAGLPPSGRLFIALVLRACARCNSRSNFGTGNLLFGFLVNHLLNRLRLRCSGTRAEVNRPRRGLAPPSLIKLPTNYQPARRRRWRLFPLARAWRGGGPREWVRAGRIILNDGPNMELEKCTYAGRPFGDSEFVAQIRLDCTPELRHRN